MIISYTDFSGAKVPIHNIIDIMRITLNNVTTKYDNPKPAFAVIKAYVENKREIMFKPAKR